jgi:hypothetical protein
MRRADGIAWWIELIVVIGSILMLLGGVLAWVRPAMLVGAAEMTAAARVFAGYFVARNLAIGGFLIGALSLRKRDALVTLLLLASAVQGADAVFDVLEGRWPIVPGVLVLGVLFGLAAMRLRRRLGNTGVTSYS